ncbi:heat shock protein 70 [Piromyces finnis]|uniref:Heat shock protein 70 n=1 Tax=Piromyces finnis TaxID=1754191 RepID=A0A1Y1UVN7_9FUNG|nr:heat shock protein 70 [Piromyces finnis]|eukprot:ORX41673.1 heat shock protein 70 [Piromyces finnis]
MINHLKNLQMIMEILNDIEIYSKGFIIIIYENEILEYGHRTTPSYIAFTPTERLIGDEAFYKAGINYKNTIYNIKRLIGRDFWDEDVQSDIDLWSFNVIKKLEKPYVRVEYKNEFKEFTPEEISSMILTKLKDNAQDYSGAPVKDAVITVPAYFNDAQRRATRDAGKIAGLNVLQIINEPTEAALAYGLNETKKGKENVLIVDLGGGTFDVSLLTINNNTFTVKATAGDTHLGGEDFTNRLVDYFVEEFKRKYDKDLSTNPRSLYRLRKACDRAKCILSFSDYASIEIEYLFDGIDFCSSITRAQFEELNSDLFEKILEPIERVLSDADLDKSDIDEIVLVGGSTRIPKIQKLVSSYFDGKKLRKTVNPDEAVACGAVIQVACLLGDFSESIKNLKLQDAIPLSLGVRIRGDIMHKVIKRNSPIPINKTIKCRTYRDNQSSMKFRICQGERTLVKDNITLGEFSLNGITLTPRGEVKINLNYDIDQNGILHITASAKGTNLSKKITISDCKGGLYQKDIEKLIKEAESYKEDDKRKKERIKTLISLENYLYNLRNYLKTIELNHFLYPNLYQTTPPTTPMNLEDEIKLTKTVNYMINWIHEHYNASKEDYEDKIKELKEVAKFIKKLC